MSSVPPPLPHLTDLISVSMLRLLRRIHREGFLLNSREITEQMAADVQRLTAENFIQPGFAGPTAGPPHQWITTPRGVHALRHFDAVCVADDDVPPVDPSQPH